MVLVAYMVDTQNIHIPRQERFRGRSTSKSYHRNPVLAYSKRARRTLSFLDPQKQESHGEKAGSCAPIEPPQALLPAKGHFSCKTSRQHRSEYLLTFELCPPEEQGHPPCDPDPRLLVRYGNRQPALFGEVHLFCRVGEDEGILVRQGDDHQEHVGDPKELEGPDNLRKWG